MLTILILVSCLLYIFYQDLRHRAVYWFLFPLLAVLLCADLYGKITFREFLTNSTSNLAFVGVQLLLLFLWLSLRNGHWVRLTRDYLGLGDILFFVCLSLYLHPVIYIAFYVISLLLILLATLFMRSRSKGGPQIPLAGLQALAFAVVLVMAALTRNSLVDGNLLTNYLE